MTDLSKESKEYVRGYLAGQTDYLQQLSDTFNTTQGLPHQAVTAAVLTFVRSKDVELSNLIALYKNLK